MGLLKIKTGCIDRLLRKSFKLYGRVINRFPFVFILTSLLIMGALASGIALFRFEYLGDEDLFTPQDLQSLEDREEVMSLFSSHYDQYQPNRDYDRDDREYLTVILASKDGGNMIRASRVGEVIKFNTGVLSIGIRLNGTEYLYDDICVSRDSRCVLPPAIDLLSAISLDNRPPEEIVDIPYPNFVDTYSNTFDVKQCFGGIRYAEGHLTHSDYVVVQYLLHDDKATDNVLSSWKATVQEYFRENPFELIDVVIVTPGCEDGFSKFIEDCWLQYLLIVVVILVVAVGTSLMLRDHVQGKPWLAAVGILSASMAATSGVGVMSFCGVTFNQVTMWMPLVVIVIGSSHVFILISSWRCNNFSNDVDETIRETMEYAGVTITIATLIEASIYIINVISPYPALREAGLYLGISLILNLLYQFTFFCPSLVISGRREAANRHSCCFTKVRPRNHSQNSCCYSLLCAGGRENHHTVVNHLAKMAFEKYYATTCHFLAVLAFVFLLYVAYISGSIYGVVSAKIGYTEPISNGNVPDANILREGASTLRHSDNPSVSLVVAGEASYWEADIEHELVSVMDNLQSTILMKGRLHTQCWFIDYYEYIETFNATREAKVIFIRTLREEFLAIPEYAKYKEDINFGEDGNIESSRCILVMEQIRDGDKALRELRDITSQAEESLGVDVILFGPRFIDFERDADLTWQLIQTAIITVSCTLFVSLLLIPNPVSAIASAALVISTLVGVIGFGTYWGVSLNPVTLTAIFVCIGLSVEFTMHITYTFHFVNMTPISRLSWALGIVGYPASQICLCVLAGAVVMLAFPGYVFHECAKLILLTPLFGLFHATLFIPTILMLLYRRDSEMMYTI